MGAKSIPVGLLASLAVTMWPWLAGASPTAIYWADSHVNFHQIARSNIDGSDIAPVVTTLNNPHGIALDVAMGKVYWTDAGNLQRADLDGSNVEDLISGGSGVLNVGDAIAIDFFSKKIYFAGRDVGGPLAIFRANLNGSNIEQLVTGHARGIALAPKQGFMCWTDDGTKTVRCAGLDGTGAFDVATGLGDPKGIAVERVGRIGGL